MNKKEDLSVLDLLSILWKNALLILATGIIFGLLAFGYVKHQNSSIPYTSETSVVIYNPSKTKYDQYGVNNKEHARMGTYQKISENTAVLKHAQDYLNKGKKDFSISQIKRAVTIKREDQTTVLTIEAKSQNKTDSIKIANATAKAVKNYLDNYINAGKVTALGKATKKGVSQNLLSTKKYLVVGIVFGLIIGILIVFVKDVIYVQLKERK